MPDLANPPLPPSVTMQQAPLTQFSQGSGQGVQQGGMPAGGAMELVGGLIAEITKKLEDVAKILAQEKPQILPMLKPVVQGLLMVQSETGQKQQPGGGGNPAPPPGMGGNPPPPPGMTQQPQGADAALSAA